MKRSVPAGVAPVLFEYLKRYQDDPTSKVFAPLAEAYRKSGFVNEAIEIAREGLQYHPQFVSGRVALARALFDLKKYPEVIEQIRWVVQEAPDNLVAQRLMAEASLMIGNVQEALQSYKMLLYFSPGDGETAHLIQELESQAYREGSLVLSSDFKEKKAGEAIGSDPSAHRDSWVKKIEILQQVLAKTEHYRTLYRLA